MVKLSAIKHAYLPSFIIHNHHHIYPLRGTPTCMSPWQLSMEASGGGKRRLVLPAPPAAKKPALQLAAGNQSDAGNWELPGAAVAASNYQRGDQEQRAAAGSLSDEEDAALLADLPNDTEAALQLLKSQFKAKVGSKARRQHRMQMPLFGKACA